MKRFITFLLVFVSIFVLSGCNTTGVAKYQKDINKVINAYSKSLNGSVKFEEGPANDLVVTEVIYSYTKEKEITAFMSKQVNKDQETSIYIKDKVAYMLLDGQKTKSALSEEDTILKIEEYGFKAFVEPIQNIYDKAFFKAVNIISSDETKAVLELDLEKYEGSINESGQITKFEVVLHYESGGIVKIENNITRGGVLNVVNVTFISTAEATIDYPADLSSYK